MEHRGARDQARPIAIRSPSDRELALQHRAANMAHSDAREVRGLIECQVLGDASGHGFRIRAAIAAMGDTAPRALLSASLRRAA